MVLDFWRNHTWTDMTKPSKIFQRWFKNGPFKPDVTGDPYITVRLRSNVLRFLMLYSQSSTTQLMFSKIHKKEVNVNQFVNESLWVASLSEIIAVRCKMIKNFPCISKNFWQKDQFSVKTFHSIFCLKHAHL